MEVKIIEDSGSKAIIEIEGETNTIPNLLKKELWNDKNVKVSGYNIENPLISKPRLVVEVSKGKAMDAVREAAKRAKDEIAKFKKAFEKAK